MSILKAKDIAKETAKLNSSFSEVMNLAIKLAGERDELKEYKENIQRFITGKSTEVRQLKSQKAELERQRDEAQRLMLKNKAEARQVIAEDLKPALTFALCQRDVALRSVRKIHKISELINTWDGNTHENWNNGPSAFDIVRHIKDVILIKEDA